jgi:hypothetical protein
MGAVRSSGAIRNTFLAYLASEVQLALGKANAAATAAPYPRVSINAQYKAADGADAAGRLNMGPATTRAFNVLMSLAGVGGTAQKGAGGYLYFLPGAYSWQVGQLLVLGTPNNIEFLGIDGEGATIFPDFASAGGVQTLLTVGGQAGQNITLRLEDINFASNNTGILTPDIDKILLTSSDINVEMERVGFFGLNATPSLTSGMEGALSLNACTGLYCRQVTVSGCSVSNGGHWFDIIGNSYSTIFVGCNLLTAGYNGGGVDKSSAAAASVVHSQGGSPFGQSAHLIFIDVAFGLNAQRSVWSDTQAGQFNDSVIFDGCTWLDGSNAGVAIDAHDTTSVIANGCTFGANAAAGLIVTRSTGNVTNWTFEDCIWLKFAFVAADLLGVANATFRRCTGFTGVNANTMTLRAGNGLLLFEQCDGIPGFTIVANPTQLKYKFSATTVNTTNAAQTATLLSFPVLPGMSAQWIADVVARATSAPAGGAIGDSFFFAVPQGAKNVGGVITTYQATAGASNTYGDATMNSVALAAPTSGGGIVNVRVNQGAGVGNNNTWTGDIEVSVG